MNSLIVSFIVKSRDCSSAVFMLFVVVIHSTSHNVRAWFSSENRSTQRTFKAHLRRCAAVLQFYAASALQVVVLTAILPFTFTFGVERNKSGAKLRHDKGPTER